MLWNPAGATFEAALAAADVDRGGAAIIGGTEVFGLFLPRYDAFHLSRAGEARLPGGRPVFPQVPAQRPEQVLTGHGLAPSAERVLDAAANCTLVTWRRAPAPAGATL
jgi:dihydrofolate reductase